MSTFVTPPRIVFGSGSLDELGRIGAGIGCRRAVLVCDPALQGLGVARRARELLEGGGLEVRTFVELSPDPTVSTIERSILAARGFGGDLVVGIGGGSALDVAKGTALGARASVELRALLRGEAEPPAPLPKILIPTTAGSGSEVSQAIVVIDELTGRKTGLHTPMLLADVAIVDPTLTLSMPSEVTVDTGIDALAHAVEAYLAANASPLSDGVALKACSLVWRHLPRAFRSGDDLEAREAMAAAALMGGMAFTWAGLGAVHALAYPLSSSRGLSHGRANAVMLPHVLAFNLDAAPKKVEGLAGALELTVGPEEGPVRTLVDAVARFVTDLGVSVRLRDHGVEQSVLGRMASDAVAGGARLLATNARAVTDADAVDILRSAW
jgi:alcohol dehydrogenase class IV